MYKNLLCEHCLYNNRCPYRGSVISGEVVGGKYIRYCEQYTPKDKSTSSQNFTSIEIKGKPLLVYIPREEFPLNITKLLELL